MEYDADSYEIKVAGSAAFETAMQRLVILNEAAGKSYKEMRVAWNINRKLPDNFPAYILFQETKIPPARRKYLLEFGNRKLLPFEQEQQPQTVGVGQNSERF